MNISQYIKSEFGMDDRSAARFIDRMRYGSFCSIEQKYFYVETPKAACTSVKWMLSELSGKRPDTAYINFETSAHMSIHYRDHNPVRSLTDHSVDEIDYILNSSEVIRFTTVRSPFTRILSAYVDKILLKEPLYRDYWVSIRNTHGTDTEQPPTFDDFIKWLHKQDKNNLDIHFMPISILNYTKFIKYTDYIHVEKFYDEIIKIVESIIMHSPIEYDADLLIRGNRYNEGLPVNPFTFYTDESKNVCTEYYKYDFTEFSYDTDFDAVEFDAKEFESTFYNRCIDLVRDKNDVIYNLSNKLHLQKK